MKIAIIGGGAAGLTTAYLLDKTHAITLFEKQPILGGNVRTLGKNVSGDGLSDGVYIDNGVIEFQRDHFVNFHRLLAKLGVQTETINGGSSSLFLANGQYLLGPGVVKKANLARPARLRATVKLLQLAPYYWKSLSADPAVFRNKPLSDFIQDGNRWHIWQKMLLMYGYSIPYPQIADFPAEIALPVLNQSRMGTRWTRVVGGVYTYMEKILAALEGEVRLNAHIATIRRDADGVEITLKTGEQSRFDKLIFAMPPDQVLALLADPSPEERDRFNAWCANHATTVIHTDLTIYQRYGVTTYTEFDVFQKDTAGGAGYNAYLNRLCGLPESVPHYNLAYNLTDWLDPAKIIHTQPHHTPLYTADALRHREVVIATNGENHTYYAGAWLGNGLHEGAVSSGYAVSHLLGGRH
jgi:predicted NAD/FAD-binding protein